MEGIPALASDINESVAGGQGDHAGSQDEQPDQDVQPDGQASSNKAGSKMEDKPEEQLDEDLKDIDADLAKSTLTKDQKIAF